MLRPELSALPRGSFQGLRLLRRGAPSDPGALTASESGNAVMRAASPQRLWQCTPGPTLRLLPLTGACLQRVELAARLEGHTDSVRALAATDTLVFSGSDDATIRAWDAETLTHVATMEGHTDNVRVLAASPHHPHLLFSGSWDKTVRVWDARTQTCLRVLHGHTEAVLALAVGRTRLATGGYDSAVMFWDIATFECVRVARGHADAVRVIEAYGDSFVSGAYDGAIGMW